MHTGAREFVSDVSACITAKDCGFASPLIPRGVLLFIHVRESWRVPFPFRRTWAWSCVDWQLNSAIDKFVLLLRLSYFHELKFSSRMWKRNKGKGGNVNFFNLSTCLSWQIAFPEKILAVSRQSNFFYFAISYATCIIERTSTFLATNIFQGSETNIYVSKGFRS